MATTESQQSSVRSSLGPKTSNPSKTRRQFFPALPPKIGPDDSLNELVIECEIAAGSTAHVYAARRRESGERVAVKVLSPHLGLVPAAVLRFRMEWEFARRIPHPNIVSVFELGYAGGHHYYAMSLESGKTGSEWRTQAIQDESRRDESFLRSTVLAVSGVVRALSDLHEVGIVHRDVKPENLLVTADGDLRLSDFGSALDTQHRDYQLRECVWGTLRYMSPEQFHADGDPYDRGTDVYAAGLTLYELVTGTCPVPQGTEEEIVRWKLTQFPPPPRRVNPRIPPRLDSLIRQAIDPDPNLRLRNARELARSLERWARRTTT